MNNTTTITRKIELYIANEDKKLYWQKIRDIDYCLYRVANSIVNALYVTKEVSSRIKEYEGCKLGEARKKAASLYHSKSYQNVSYRVTCQDEFKFIPSDIRTSLASNIYKVFNSDSKELFSGKRSVRTYKKGLPIPFSATRFKISKSKKDRLFIKWVDGFKFGFVFGKDRSNNEEIVNRIVSGEYKKLGSSIQIDGKKIFLLLVVQVPVVQTILDQSKIVGVDLGINVPAYVCLNIGKARKAIGSREGFIAPRIRIAAQRRILQKNLKFTKGGKGRKKKLARLEKLRKAERNTVKTLNHKIAKDVIDFTLKNGAGVVQLEKLTGIARDKKNKWILRNWSYFELQNFIEYKAKKHGIEVRYINPAYTSQTCPSCSHVSRENRKTQSQFECVECGFKDNADWVAAYNIANSTDYLNKKGKNKKVLALG